MRSRKSWFTGTAGARSCRTAMELADRGRSAVVDRNVGSGQRPGLERQRPHHRKPLIRGGRAAEIVPWLVAEEEPTDLPPRARARVGSGRLSVFVAHVASILEPALREHRRRLGDPLSALEYASAHDPLF